MNASQTKDLSDHHDDDLVLLQVGGLSRAQLFAELKANHVSFNGHAAALLAHAAFDEGPEVSLLVASRSVAQLGLADGATLPAIFSAAQSQGLKLCPADTAPYLRLAMTGQEESTNSMMSDGSAPDGSLTVASVPLSDDDEFPKGFYLRVVDDQLWLRGYRCDNLHVFAPTDRFVFVVQ